MGGLEHRKLQTSLLACKLVAFKFSRFRCQQSRITLNSVEFVLFGSQNLPIVKF